MKEYVITKNGERCRNLGFDSIEGISLTVETEKDLRKRFPNDVWSHEEYNEDIHGKINSISKNQISSEPLNTHKGMIMRTENGNVAHVLADPNMSKETESAIAKMIDLAHNMDLEEKKENEKIPCFACQGGGCPVCCGYGYYYN